MNDLSTNLPSNTRKREDQTAHRIIALVDCRSAKDSHLFMVRIGTLEMVKNEEKKYKPSCWTCVLALYGSTYETSSQGD
jgi:hypothetical protein